MCGAGLEALTETQSIDGRCGRPICVILDEIDGTVGSEGQVCVRIITWLFLSCVRARVCVRGSLVLFIIWKMERAHWTVQLGRVLLGFCWRWHRRILPAQRKRKLPAKRTQRYFEKYLEWMSPWADQMISGAARSRRRWCVRRECSEGELPSLIQTAEKRNFQNTAQANHLYLQRPVRLICFTLFYARMISCSFTSCFFHRYATPLRPVSRDCLKLRNLTAHNCVSACAAAATCPDSQIYCSLCSAAHCSTARYLYVNLRHPCLIRFLINTFRQRRGDQNQQAGSHLTLRDASWRHKSLCYRITGTLNRDSSTISTS